MEQTMESVLEQTLGKVNQGDCIAGMKKLPPESVNLVFADPPFNIGYDYDEYDDQLDSNQYLSWSRDWISEVYRVLHESGAFWLAIGDEYAAELKVEAQKIGFHTRSWVVWYYTFGVHCKLKFTRSHAHLFHFVKNPKAFVFNSQDVAVPSARQLVYGDKRANPSGRMPDDTWILRPQDCVDGFTADEDTWFFPRVAGTFKERAGFHGCQMPEQLLGRIVLSCSNPGDVVMDPFSGSCTTLTVAKKKGRRFIGFEMSKEYVKLGSKRIEAACEGDELDGSPDPKVSAPATDSPKARRSKNAPPDQRSFSPLFEFSKIDTETDGIVEAFARSNRGYSVDRLVADPILNEDFQTQCERLSIPGTQAERNRFLFRIRKSGKLKQCGIETSNITSFDWEHLDPFLYASEIAWRRVSELYANASLEEILCDPRLAKQFDEVAVSLAEGYSPLEYRWAALKLRKQGSTARKRGLALSLHKFVAEDWFSLGDLQLSELGPTPGLYAIRSNDDYLYAGETSNMRARLGLQLSENAIHRWPPKQRERSELSIAIREVATVEDARLARQSCLLKWYRPQWNFNDLI
jgi:DNA modification methylase